ncbi:hypothetical protein GQ457_11G029880 [Hibiscus cannabinus]
MINFPSQRVRDWVLESGPWHIQQRVIVLRKWVPRLKFDVLRLDATPIWVKLWHIPLELYSQQGLGYIASAIGKPLYSARATVLKKQLDYAKVCVEIDAKDDLPGSVMVELDDGYTEDVAVELVWSSPSCKHCTIFGHSDYKCSKIVVHVVSAVEVAPAVEVPMHKEVVEFCSDSGDVVVPGFDGVNA